MSLSRVAAEALVDDYLNGRALPLGVREAVVSAAKARLIDGKLPILDETLCGDVDHAAAPVDAPAQQAAGQPESPVLSSQKGLQRSF